jgi:alpha-ribazole phosphatase/probable phosphoglycerate mutase
VLLVAHSGTLRALLAHALGAPPAACRRLAVPYACWSRFRHADGRTVLIWHNRASAV